LRGAPPLTFTVAFRAIPCYQLRACGAYVLTYRHWGRRFKAKNTDRID
jgi:hypothetical protein